MTSNTPQTIVIKVGGGEGIDPTNLTREIAQLTNDGHRVVLVHGGSHETNMLAEALGHPTQTITSPGGHQSRRTDRQTLEIFEMVYCGKVNKAVVESLRAAGVDAIGLSGIDAGIWTGSRKGAIRAVEDGRTVIIRDDLSGRVESVDADFLNTIMDLGRVPVLTPPAITPEGVAINVDADRAAAATAAALGADELLLLSNVPGLLLDHTDPGSLIESVDGDGLEIARGAAKGRMKNKVLAAEEAIRGGVARVVIGSAGGDQPIRAARTGRGTVFTQTNPTMVNA
ncbi:MAG: acetylglutamate kinase [Phycisphaerae bacterium]|nr:acetylglutamate kinase [Phycisphaerae bacterium]MBM91695.1 acetylglutamate kinase [Phycisphaerae bacterium]MBM92560.1 acetylglutamate kinase [Phycisphaerae bacterium]